MQHNYNVFFRESRRHKWRYRNSYSLTPFEGLGQLRDILRDRLRRLRRERGKTPGFAIVRDNAGIVLMSMRKATWRKIPQGEKALIEQRVEEPDTRVADMQDESRRMEANRELARQDDAERWQAEHGG